MQRYFLKNKEGNNLIFFEQDLHHIKNVMRFRENDQIEAIWNEVIYLCKIDSIDPFSVKVIKEEQSTKENNVKLSVAISLVQEQKFDLILQKLTELGIDNIIPIKTERSIIKIDEKKISKKYQRWQTICKEASEQSHRTNIPKINPIIKLKDLNKIDCEIKLICSLDNKSKPLDEYLTKDIKEILFVIGPEGGLTDQEEKCLIDYGFKQTTLGKQILRVETAAIYVASIINYVYGG